MDGRYGATGLWTSTSVGWSLPLAAARWPDRVALAFGSATEATRRLTFGELYGPVRALAADLVEHGVAPGDRVLVQLPNRPELVALVLAAWHVGAVAVPVVPMYRQAEMRHILRVTRPAVVASVAARGGRRPAEELDELLGELGQRPVVRYVIDGGLAGWTAPPGPTRRYEDYRAELYSIDFSNVEYHKNELDTVELNIARSASVDGGPGDGKAGSVEVHNVEACSVEVGLVESENVETQNPHRACGVARGGHRPAGPDECCLVLFTSGTTAEPKGVRHSSRSLLCEARSYRDEALLGPRDPVLVPAPLAHIGAIVAATLLPGLTAARTVVLGAWDPDVAVRMCDAERVALAIGAPVFLSELLDRYEAADAAGAPVGHRIAMFHTGAAPTGDSVVVRAERLGVTAWRAWGMTEAPTMTCGGPDGPLARRATTDGRVDVGCEVQAVDEQRRPRPSGQPGELRVRGPKLMLGYLDPAHQAERVDAEGWLYTGDVGTVDSDGWVTIRGRLKDIINRGGEKFACAEIEDAIAAHPAVEAVAVVGLPDPRLGEQVGAFVTVRPGVDWPGAAALLAHLEEHRLARQKLPTVWQVRDALPRTATGKILKRTLLTEWTAAHASSRPGPGAA